MLTVATVPVVLALVFPYRALQFKATAARRHSVASASFVSLSDAELAEAMRSAKTSWQVNADGRRQTRVDLSVGELPDDITGRPADIVTAPQRSESAAVPYGFSAYPVSQAAPAPVKLKVDPDENGLNRAFSKTELLKIERN